MMSKWFVFILVGCAVQSGAQAKAVEGRCDTTAVADGETVKIHFPIEKDVNLEGDPNLLIRITKENERGDLLRCDRADPFSNIKCVVLDNRFLSGGLNGRSLSVLLLNASTAMEGLYSLRVVNNGTFRPAQSCMFTLSEREDVKPDGRSDTNTNTSELVAVYVSIAVISIVTTVVSVCFCKRSREQKGPEHKPKRVDQSYRTTRSSPQRDDDPADEENNEGVALRVKVVARGGFDDSDANMSSHTPFLKESPGYSDKDNTETAVAPVSGVWKRGVEGSDSIKLLHKVGQSGNIDQTGNVESGRDKDFVDVTNQKKGFTTGSKDSPTSQQTTVLDNVDQTNKRKIREAHTAPDKTGEQKEVSTVFENSRIQDKAAQAEACNVKDTLSPEDRSLVSEKMPKDDESKLLQSSPQGSFLIRQNDRIKQNYTLAVSCNKKAKRFQIAPQGTQFCVLETGTVFISLSELTTHYQNHDIIDSTGKLYCRLSTLYRENDVQKLKNKTSQPTPLEKKQKVARSKQSKSQEAGKKHSSKST